MSRSKQVREGSTYCSEYYEFPIVSRQTSIGAYIQAYRLWKHASISSLFLLEFNLLS